MFQYRVTKFDPAKRSPSGVYTAHEWASFADVGKSFNGVLLTLEDYQKVEEAYVSTAYHLLQESGAVSLWVVGLENYAELPLSLHEGKKLESEELQAAFRSVLREQYWCRFEDPAGRFVHFGRDYYMYIGVPEPCWRAIEFATAKGLFVERFESPYASDYWNL